MKRAAFQTIREIHAWAGAVIGLVLLALSVSGTLLVFKTEYLKLVLPEARVEADLTPAALASVTERAEARFGGEMTAIVFADDDFGLHRVYLGHGGGAYLDGSGAVVTAWEKNGRFEEWLFDLHHHLLAGHSGEVVAGIVAVCTVVLVAGGLIAFWPMRRGWRRRLRADSLGRQDMRSFHRNLGLLSALPALIVAVTGAALVFPGAAKGLLGGGGAEAPSSEVIMAGDTSTAAGLAASLEGEALGQIRIAVPRKGDQAAFLRLRQQGEWHPNGRSVIAPDGEGMLALRDAQTFALPERIYNAAYPVHAAKFGGLLPKVLLFLGGSALSLLIGAGLWSFLQRTFVTNALGRLRLRRQPAPLGR